jgi:predicted HicB family RNase H-like nuclease
LLGYSWHPTTNGAHNMNDPYEDDMKALHEKMKQERLAQSYDQQLKDHIAELEDQLETAKSAYSDLLVNSMNLAGQDRVRIKALETDIIKIEKVSDFNADRVKELKKKNERLAQSDFLCDDCSGYFPASLLSTRGPSNLKARQCPACRNYNQACDVIRDLTEQLDKLKSELSHENDLFLEMRQHKESLETDIIKIEKVSDFNADRVKELEKGTALACQLYGHTNFDVEYDGFTFLRCSVCGVNKDDQND